MREQENLFRNQDPYYHQLENDTGHFFCNQDMIVTRFRPKEANCLLRSPFGFCFAYPDKTDNALKNLLIPEGVEKISGTWSGGGDHETFREYIIIEKLRFPQTLDEIGDCAFSGCLIMDMELPLSLRGIGSGSFMCCYIHTLRIPKGLPAPEISCDMPPGNDHWEQAKKKGLACGGRQFKETIINTLIVPQDYPYSRLMPAARIDNVVFC